MKKLVSYVLLIATMLNILVISASASTTGILEEDFSGISLNMDRIAYYTISDEELNASFQQQIEEEVAKLQSIIAKRGGDDQVVETEIVGEYLTSVNGEAANQYPEGARCSGFFWKDKGGVIKNISVTVGLKSIPISVSFGISSNSESYELHCNTPDNVNYYKLWVQKDFAVQEMNLYLRDTMTGERTYYGTSYPSTQLSVALYCKKVK